MTNCPILLNDGSSFILLNDGASVILLNDDSCGGGSSGVGSSGGGGRGLRPRDRRRAKRLAYERRLLEQKRKEWQEWDSILTPRDQPPSKALPMVAKAKPKPVSEQPTSELTEAEYFDLLRVYINLLRRLPRGK